MKAIIDQLMRSEEPAVRYKVMVGALGADPGSNDVKRLQEEIRTSARVQRLLSGRQEDGRIEPIKKVYSKWQGAHWVLGTLADIGYPAGDESLRAAMDQVFEQWLQPFYVKESVSESFPSPNNRTGVPVIQGRARRCASQQGLALFAAVRLGLVDGREEQLVERLLHWQWPDGGWNCDRNPEAAQSSFFETAIPLRALAVYAKWSGNVKAREASMRAADIFLSRGLYRRKRDGEVMDRQFVELHYPCYWHYDILHGLKIMAEAGLIGDPRCADALDLLESKRLPDGGWPAEAKFYKTSGGGSGVELVSWGPTGTRKMNEWTTADALYVLKEARRLG
jgi:hypothetical protein